MLASLAQSADPSDVQSAYAMLFLVTLLLLVFFATVAGVAYIRHKRRQSEARRRQQRRHRDLQDAWAEAARRVKVEPADEADLDP